MAPGTLYRRAIARVERRTATVLALRPLAYAGAPIIVGEPVAGWGHCPDCELAARLLNQAVRTANRLAYCAGIAGPLAKKEVRS